MLDPRPDSPNPLPLRRPGRWLYTRSVLSALALVLIPQLAIPQETGSVAGRVETHGDGGLALATAGLPELALSTSVAADGTFRFDGVPAGSHVLIVEVPAVGLARRTITVAAGQETTVELEIDHITHADEIVVTATGDPRSTSELSNAVSVLTGADLQLRMGATLGETLADEPGVSSTAFVPGAGRPIIRGLSGARVRVLTGGLGTGDASAVSADHAVTSEPAQAEQIEVLRGPATLRYGSGAIGGAVNIIDGRIPTTRAAKTFGGTVDLAGGSVADERMGALEFKGGAGDWAWTLAASSRETDPYEIPGHSRLEDDNDEDDHDNDEDDHDEDEDDHDEDDEHVENPFGIVPNTDLHTDSGRFGVTRFFGDRGFLGVSLSGFNTDYGIPPGAHSHEGEEHEDDRGDEDDHGDEELPVRVDMKQQRLDLRSDIHLPAGGFEKLEVRMAGTDYEHVELEGSEIGTRLTNDYFETRVELFQRVRSASRGSVGLQYSNRDLAAVGEEAYIPPTASNSWAVFTSQEIEQGAVRWQFGARFEQSEYDPTGDESWSGDGISASAGLVWKADDAWTLGLSASRSVRLPSAEELFANGIHVATLTYEVGDPDLDREIGNGLDLSLRRTKGRVQGELTLFQQDFEDFIYQAFTGAAVEDIAVVRYSQANAKTTGAELTARIEVLEWQDNHLHVQVIGDTVSAELDQDGNLPRIPPLSFGAGLHYHGHDWRAAVEWRWTDRQNDVAVQETPTDGYTMVNAHVGRRFTLRNQLLDILLRGRNLTDEEARIHTSFLKTFAPLPGRDISLSARFWF